MFHQSEQYYYDTVGASPLEQEQGHGNPGATRSSQQHYYCNKNSNNIETTTTKNDKSSSSSNREDWHDIFVDLTYPMSSLKSDPVHCFHITFNELSKERPDLCKTTHLGHVLELPSDEKGKNVFLTRYYQLYKKRKQGRGGGARSDDGNSSSATSSSNGANDAFNNMIKNLKNRGYKRKGNLLLLPFHQIKKCIDMTVAQNNMKTDDGRGWCIENQKDAKDQFQANFNELWTNRDIFKCRFKIRFQEIESVLLKFFYYKKFEKDKTLIFCETDETIPTSIHSEDLIWMMESSKSSSSSWTNQTTTNDERTVEYYIQAVAICTRLASRITHDYAWLEDKLLTTVVSSIPNGNNDQDRT